MTNTNVTTSGDLYVTCYLGNDETTPTSYSDFFAGELTYSSSKWDTDPTHYWPTTTIGGSETECLSFFAYSSTVDNTGLSFSKNSYPTTYPQLTYTVQSTSANQKDIIAADPIEKQIYTTNATTNGQADLKFEHILSQIRIKVFGATAGYTYTVTALSIGKDLNDQSTNLLYNQGTYQFAALSSGARASSTTPKTTGDGITASYAYPVDPAGDNAVSFATTSSSYKDASTAAFLGSGTTAAGASYPLMLMPQTIATGETNADKAAIVITYSVTDGTNTTFNGSKKVALSQTGTTAWEKGKCYTYALKLAAGDYPITYSVDVTDWSDATAIAIDVQ